MNPGGGSKGGYGEPQPAGYGQPITPPPAYGQPAAGYGQQAPSYTYGNPDTMPVSAQPQHTAITVVQAPMVITWKHGQKFGKDNRNTSQQFGREPMETFCPRCQKNVRTTTIKKTSQTAYLYAIILCLCWWVHWVSVQSWENFFVRGLVKFIPAVAYHICLNLPASFSQPRTKKFSHLCTTQKKPIWHMSNFSYCLACIPCCMDSCKNVEHSCPSCGAQLGIYKA